MAPRRQSNDEPEPQKPTVDSDDLDRQIDEMLGPPETVGGMEPPASPAPTREPEVVASAPAPAPSTDDRLTAALQTIDNLKREFDDYRTRASATPAMPADASRPEPSIEFDTVLGRRVPRDRSKRAIKLTADDLHRLGWNEDPAKAIEDLGNALFDFLIEVVPGYTTQTWEQRTSAESRQRQSLDNFWSAHADLRDQQAFVKTVEDMSLADGSLNPRVFRDQGEYNVALGRKAREKIAAMRGLTYDQYLAAVGPASGGGTPAPASRAVSTSLGASSRGPRQVAEGNPSQRAEMDDLIDHR